MRSRIDFVNLSKSSFNTPDSYSCRVCAQSAMFGSVNSIHSYLRQWRKFCWPSTAWCRCRVVGSSFSTVGGHDTDHQKGVGGHNWVKGVRIRHCAGFNKQNTAPLSKSTVCVEHLERCEQCQQICWSEWVGYCCL